MPASITQNSMFGNLPMEPFPEGIAQINLPDLPEEPETRNQQSQQINDPSVLPRIFINAGYDSDSDYESQYEWLASNFTGYVNQYPELQNNFLRSSSGDPTLYGSWDWQNMLISHARDIRNVGKKVLEKSEDRTRLEQEIKKKACFAIYYSQQAPEVFRMPDHMLKYYVNLLWSWTVWMNSSPEE